MKRRDTIKSLLIGGVAGTTIAASSCKEENILAEETTIQSNGYGRTPSEEKHDAEVAAEIFLTEYELNTISTLCDIILPATPTAGSAIDAEVPAFIDFIVKDLPAHQLPMRGGLMWLDGESTSRYNKAFTDLSNAEQLSIVDDIAYPDPNNERAQMSQGIAFFSRLRNLTLTGYYTTRIGISDLGYKGNIPNTWDGPPQEVLDKHGLSYEKSWIPKFVDHETRNIQAEWDDDGNLLT